MHMQNYLWAKKTTCKCLNGSSIHNMQHAGTRLCKCLCTIISEPVRERPSGLFNPLPYGVMLYGHHSRCQQLKLLLNLEPVAACGHLDTIMKDSAKGIPLQSPAPAQSRMHLHLRMPL